MPHRGLTALIFACSALLLAGCGDAGKPSVSNGQSSAIHSAEGDTGSTAIDAVALPEPDGKPLTRARLIAEADAVCERVNKKRTTVNFGTQASIAASMPALAAFERNAADELANLKAPASLRATYRQVVAGARALANESARYGEYARTGDLVGESRLFDSARTAQTRMALVARRHHFRACSDL